MIKEISKLSKKTKLIISISALAVIIIGGYAYFNKGSAPAYDFAIAKRDNIIQEVSVTGRVKPAKSVDLAFEKSGKVSRVYVDVGDKAKIGEALVSLENAELAAQLNQAAANMKAQKAKLEELRRGTRPEEIQVQETKVANAKITLEDAKKNLIDKLQDSYTKSDDTIRNKIDQLFTTPQGTPNLIFQIYDFQLKTDIEAERMLIETTLRSWKSSLDQITLSSDINSQLNTAKKNLSQIVSFLDKVALAVNSATAYTGLSQTTIDAWKADVSTGRTTINTAITNLTTAEEKLRSAESDLVLAENELALEKAGTISEQITAQEAQVESALANLQNIQAQIAKTIIRSPLNGIITKQDAKVGEIVPANTPIVSVISEAKFEVEAMIPEADIAKVKVGDTAEITLDAYGNDVVFEARVITIDPAETIVEGVATYKTILQFTKEDEKIKSGMTANIDILTAKLENVIAIPQRAIITRNGDKIVKIIDGQNTKEVKVKTGLRDSNSNNIEITEGIQEGDKVVIPSKEE